ncbi:hypothetical protein RHSIM_Rhsim07G0114600 [Rhododendron simsii]|uniref:Uncharacterized protein n=1 Tax=Rhododendron simsii TaxID=118357 RepID=A0A834GRY8_RHOSS|nr:hypothetical protein RHSIM_Rhsim07G0114600 [Rhododendron simsii]
MSFLYFWIVKIAQEGLDYDFKKHFTRTEFRDLFDFTSKAIGYEAILMEREYRKNKSLDTYYQDIEGDVKIDVAQVIGKAPIICDTLTKAEKPVNMFSSHPNRRNQANFRQYSFDLSKANQLFDELINQKFLTVSPGLVIHPEKDRKGKDYRKWHNSFRYNTNNCVTFRNCIQNLIQKGLLQYAKGNKEVMRIDIDLFLLVEVNVVTARLKKGKMASQVERRIQKEEIYVGPKLIFEDEDPEIFIPFELLKWYGEDDGPFLIKGYPVLPALPGKPDISLIYPPMFTNERGRGFYPKGTKSRIQEEFEKEEVLMEDDEDDDLLSIDGSDIMKDDFKDDKNEVNSQKFTTFGQALDTIQYGLVSPTKLLCNMILVLPKNFQSNFLIMYGPNTGTTFNGSINVAFINVRSYTISQQMPEPASRHTVFAFLIPTLFNFLDLQYQGNDSVSPLQTHRKTMWVAVSSLLLYCFWYELEPKFAQLCRVGMGVFGSILSVSLAALLFQNSVLSALYFLYVLFFNREVLCSCIELFWSWIHQKMIADPLRETQLVNWRSIVMPAPVNRGGLLPL